MASYQSFADGPGSGFVWLDGRKMINEVTDDPIESGMTLRAAFIDENGTLHNEQLVDELICDCCQTDVAIAAGLVRWPFTGIALSMKSGTYT